MNILALDLGTKTGFAYSSSDGFACGTWELATKKEITEWGESRLTRRRDPRITRLRVYLHSVPEPNIVVFEDVQFASYTYQVQLWSSLRAVIWLTLPGSVIDCVPVATLKKFATGAGNATKPMMKAAAKKNAYLYNLSPGLDDNALDAAWLWVWALKNLGRTKV